MRKSVIFILLVLGLTLYLGGFSLLRAQDEAFANLQLCVDGGKLYFFQPQTGKIYVYQVTTNRFNHLLTLEKLGQDLKKSRSLSFIEQSETY